MPAVKWFVRNQQIGNGRDLTIPNVSKTNATIYTCEASNNVGQSRATARLVVFGECKIM